MIGRRDVRNKLEINHHTTTHTQDVKQSNRQSTVNKSIVLSLRCFFNSRSFSQCLHYSSLFASSPCSSDSDSMVSSQSNVFAGAAGVKLLNNYHQVIANTSALIHQLMSWRRSKPSNHLTRFNRQKLTDCHHRLAIDNPIPMVSFGDDSHYRLDGRPADRIWLNDNELYSLSGTRLLSQSSQTVGQLNGHTIQTNNNRPLTESLSLLSLNSAPPPPRRDDSLNGINGQPKWFQGTIDRQAAIDGLRSAAVGNFLVRYSTSKSGCYALSIRVPRQFHPSLVAHYLIIRTARDTYKIKGFAKEFASLESLIVHHSIMQELLPCALNLNFKQRDDDQQCDAGHSSDQSDDHYDERRMKTEDDVHVDVDSDADYRRLMSHFRKTMANCG